MKNARNDPEFRKIILAAFPTLPAKASLCLMAFLLMLLFQLPFARPASAQGTCDKVTVGYSYYPPFSYQSPDGGVHGASIEVAKRAFQKMDVNVELVQMPWARLLLETQNGGVDFITAAYRTRDRLSWATYSDIPIGYERIVAIHDKTIDIDNPSLEDLRRKRGLLRRGDSHGVEVDTAIAKNQLSITEVPEIEVGLRMITAGRADYLLTSDAVARDVLRNHDFPDLVFDRVNVAGEALYALFSKHSNCIVLADRFNETIRSLYQDDLMPTVLVQYLKSVGSPLIFGMAEDNGRNMLGN
ncbi:substrate-binding periplasmic protein [Thalassospira marina]|uniref:Solute-binding protein family 3/N-terminal domain-containing protein n=1 Tax=Thalassospira marina TaxID=2048283 RepID=A0A2N3KRE1_9PROT|nr:transporter substrate-binding domain-containing protein [Thalassospira marina]AUG53544.1 hypothetical protein CSC3H3_13090 [Thalassospira marina]PKR53076.1 hypothetical protein COO20_15465 [Thalassospira marina]